MGRVYSTRLIQVHAGGTADYVVPSGFRAVVRFITCFNADIAITRGAQIVLLGSDVTVYQSTVGPQAVKYDDYHLVVEQLDTIQAIVDPETDFTVSGYVLALP